jgi:hypothetical protein
VSRSAAVVLAAGRGTRLRPLTEIRPKPLCPVGNVPLIDRVLQRLDGLGLRGPDDVAVNTHHLADQLVAHVDGRAHLSREDPAPLGTAGALGLLRGWIDGRDVLVCNADTYLAGQTARLLRGWSGERSRLLVSYAPDRGDFGPWRHIGMALLPWATVQRLEPVPSGLYEEVWRHDRPELTSFPGIAYDCGTPTDYLAANLHASGGRSVVGAGATVLGELVRSVVWPGGVVRAGERLVEAVRVGADITVPARQHDRR